MSAKPTDSACDKNRTADKRAGSGAVKTAFGGAALGIALILAYVETILPINIGVPGIKLGLPNLAVLFLLYKHGFLPALAVSCLRVILCGILFGNFTSFLYAASGALLSLAVMAVLKKTDAFSPTGVSVAGGISHNLAQICAAAVILDTSAVAYYLPALIISGTVCGAGIGILGGIMIKKVRI